MQILSSIGLISNIIGVVLAFFFGFPQPNFHSGVALIIEDDTPVGNGKTARDEIKSSKLKKQLYRSLSLLSLILLIIGFGFQLIAVWL